MTELLPVLMNDIIATAPQEQKVRSTRSRIEEMSTPVPTSESRMVGQTRCADFAFAEFSHRQSVSYGSTHVL
jgi:hypothetical protein